MTTSPLSVKGEKLRYLTNGAETEKLITGTDTGANGTAGELFKVKGTALYWTDNNGDIRSKVGIDTGENGVAGQSDIKVKGDVVRYTDDNGDIREASSDIIAVSDDDTSFDGQGLVTAINAVYATAHDQAVADFLTNFNQNHTVGQRYNQSGDGDYRILRCFIRFDLAELASGVSVVSAVMSIRARLALHYTDWNFTLVDGSDAANPLVKADYGDLLDETTSLGAVAVSTITPFTRFEITLTAAGRAFLELKAEGVAIFGIRSSDDIASVLPPDYNQSRFTELNFETSIGSNPAKPTLTITV